MSRRIVSSAVVTLASLSFLRLLSGDKPGAKSGTGAQLAAQVPSGDDFVIHQDVRLVLLDAGVTNHAGNYISGLPKESFSVTENGKSYPITIFDNSDLPVTLGIIVDESGSMAPRHSHVITAAEALIQESNPMDEVFVLNFNDLVSRGLPDSMLFSSNIAQLQAALRRGIPQGRTALYDAVTTGLSQLESGRKGRKALVVISDGGDTVSQKKRAEMFSQLERSGATIYGIGLFTPGDADSDPGVINHMARMSGGEAFFPTQTDELAVACRRIAKAIRSRYVVGYRPPEGRLGELRHVRVQAKKGSGASLNVLSRSSYRYGEGVTISEVRPDASKR